MEVRFHGPFSVIQGKLLAAFTAVCGVLVMALPIPIVVDNFADYYKEQKKAEAKELKKEAQAKQAVVDKAAEEVANKGLVGTLTSKPGAFHTPPLSPKIGANKSCQNGSLGHKF